jgi:hypothetical protein
VSEDAGPLLRVSSDDTQGVGRRRDRHDIIESDSSTCRLSDQHPTALVSMNGKTMKLTLLPYRPEIAAGIRTDPPVSVPSAKSSQE